MAKSFLMLLIAISFAFSAQAQAKKLTKIKAGHMVALDMAPLFVAKESDCFKKQGLDVELVFFPNAGDSNAALAGGKIDFVTNPFTLPFFAANSNIPIRVISAAGGWGIIEVIAQKSLNINSTKDMANYIKNHPLKKLKIGIVKGDTLELILIRAFANENIDEKQVELINFQDFFGMVEAFRHGKLDILSHIKPYTTDLIYTKGATLVTNNAKIWGIHTPNCTVSVLESTLNKRSEIVDAYLKGLICAADIINNYPGKAVKLIQKGNYFRVPPKILLDAFASAPAPISFIPNVSSVQTVVDDLTKMGYIKGKTKAENIFALNRIKNLEKARGEKSK